MVEPKFFTELLDNDLDRLTEILLEKYKLLSDYDPTDTDEFLSSGSISTVRWRDYNVFQFHVPEIRELYRAVSRLTELACEHYDIDFESQNFMVQGWFNVNYSTVGNLDWHDHGEPNKNSFHGYYCVNAEPSTTSYEVGDSTVALDNKNNVAMLSEIRYRHRQDPWSWAGPRISVAYDVVPLDKLIANTHKQESELHWVPLS